MQGGHRPGKVWEFDNGQGKVRKSAKSQGNVFFACDVLPRLRWSQNKHSLIAWVLLSADDMIVMDWQRSKRQLILPMIHIIVIMFYLSHLYTVAGML